MQTAVNIISRLVTDHSTSAKVAEPEGRLRFGGLHHRFSAHLIEGIHTIETARRLAAQLVSIAERAYERRQLDIVGSAGLALVSLPLAQEYRSVGLFYLTFCISGGKDNPAKARIFERLADRAPSAYRAKALLALGTNSIHSDHKAARCFLQEAMKLMARDRTHDPVTALRVTQNTAVVIGSEGDHQRALTGLLALYPLARTARLLDGVAYPDYLNSLAVELTEVGRLEEARRVSQTALATPLASAFPEWAETLVDIEVKLRGASRSVVAVPPVSQTHSALNDSMARIVSWPDDYCYQGESAAPGANHSASIVSLQDWKRRLETKSKPDVRKTPTSEEIRSMNLTEKQAAITRCVYDEEVKEEMLDSILQVALTRDTGKGESA